ncbi:hypothetical protein GX411_01235 [Candidatus Fermentibacteria bacterium]|nr:hypothetical protein [Candidatus Fermentibacteria bacterium]
MNRLLFALVLSLTLSCGGSGGEQPTGGEAQGTTAGVEASEAVEATEAVSGTPAVTAPTGAVPYARGVAATANQRTATMDSTLNAIEGGR